MPNRKNWYLGQICTRCKQNLEKKTQKVKKKSPKSKIGPKMAKNGYFRPKFCQANNLPTIFGYLQKMGQKAIFQIFNYGQLWPIMA